MSQPPFDDDRAPNRDALDRDDSLAWIRSFVIPDDISALEADIAQWHEEQRRADEAARKSAFRRRPHRYGATALLLIVTLLLAGGMGSAMVLLGPRPTRTPLQSPRPLASTTVDPGSIGGLLPTVRLTSRNGSPVDIRSLRPAIITLVPANCGCAPTINHLAAAASPYGVQQYVIAPDEDSLAALAQSSSMPNGMIDGGVLRAQFGGRPDLPTIVVVAADGVIRAVEVGAGPTTTVNGYLDTIASAAGS